VICSAMCCRGKPRAGDRWLDRSPRPLQSPLQQFDPVWLFPASYALHLSEEYFAAGGFPRWAHRTLALDFSDAEFVAWNVFALVLMIVAAWLVSRDPKFRFIEIALAIAVLGNVVAHVLGSLITWTYSPGLVTGVCLWIPFGVVRLRRAWAASRRTARLAGMYLGLSVVFVSLVVVAASTIFDR
jgi:hypothetical protein